MSQTADAEPVTSDEAHAPPRPRDGFRTPEQEQAEAGAEVPDASELTIEQINPVNAHLYADDRWHGHHARLRAEDPIHFNEIETAGRYWSVTKASDIKAVEADWETFSSANGITLGIPVEHMRNQGGLRTFIAMDPPNHREQRRTVTPSVQPKSLENVEPLIRERTVEVLDSLPEGEVFDWVPTVSVELTTRMLATLFDFPFEDRAMLTRWSDIVFALPEPGGLIESHQQRYDELMGCVAYFSDLWEERRVNPGHDLVSMLVHGDVTGQMPMAAHLGNILLLIVGGNDTTRNTMSGSVYALNTFPDQYDRLIADPGLLENFVPEMLRWQTPLSYMRRTATADTELGGKQIRKDDQVLMWYVSGNRDEDVFDRADDLDLERENTHKHLAFGYGIHYCVGSRLAELQLKILWEELLPRIERIELQDEPERTFSTFIHGYTHMPVQVTRR